jgi:alkylhydroperoxidase/carboxymuconolactone decarboxylase family protein YurZ
MSAKLQDRYKRGTLPAVRKDQMPALTIKPTRELGATKEEIAEALGVGVSVNAGAALVYSTRTLDAFDATA